MTEKEMLEKVLATAKRLADYANLCYTNDSQSHENHYRYIEVQLLKVVRECEGHLTPIAADEVCGCVPAGDNSVSPGFVPALKCTACGKLRC